MASWFAFGAAPEAAAVAAAERRPGMVCLWWLGEPGRMENNLVVLPEEAGDAEAALAGTAERLAASGIATDLRLPAGAGSAAWGAAARRRGFILEETDPIIMRDLAAAPTAWRSAWPRRRTPARSSGPSR